jgi:type I restriction enzyme M protein
VNLDIFWLRDKSLEESDDLPDPDVLAQEIADDMQRRWNSSQRLPRS